jgi:hypothetical protein
MIILRPRVTFFIVILCFLITAPSLAGLYDADSKEAKTGDIADQDYWWIKYDMMMLDLAIKTKQPEGRIAVNLAVTQRRIDDLMKKYPNHEELKKMKAHVEEVNKKINPDARRNENFMPNCPWDEANFAQLWVNFHTGKMLYEEKQYDKAFTLFVNVQENYKIMLAPDRMKEYPEELSKWVKDHKEEADKIYADLKSHLNRK